MDVISERYTEEDSRSTFIASRGFTTVRNSRVENEIEEESEMKL